MLLVLFGLFSLSWHSTNGLLGNPIIETDDVGVIKGLHAEDGDYSMFLGIPFGEIDKNNPFGVASPYPKFERTFEAFDDSVVCPQIEEFNHTLVGSLDCLTLNIFVPSTATNNSHLPVLVYIYGGGFSYGSGNRFLYGPKFLVKHDIILVTINYRLGPYGFMCLHTPEVPGNQGLKDQVLALRWIKKHIGAFHGDADKVTISGNSAGALSVDYHLVSNNEKLFDKVIMQSGNLMNTLNGFEPITDSPIILANHLGFVTSNVAEAMAFLSVQDSLSVIAGANELGLIFQPCVERQLDDVESFITENWITARLPKVKDVPIITGFNNDEMRLMYNQGMPNMIPIVLQSVFNVSHPDFDGMEDIARHYYIGDNETNQQGLIDFASDFAFVHPVYRAIKKYLEYGAGNIFLYVFSYVNQRNLMRHLNNISSDFDGGAVHTDELGFLFDISFMKDMEITPEEQLVVDRITSLWTNFVKYGDPTPETSDVLPVKWIPITTNNLKRPYLKIGSDLVRRSRPFSQRAAFLDLFYRSNEHLQIFVSVPSSSFIIQNQPLFYIAIVFFTLKVPTAIRFINC